MAGPIMAGEMAQTQREPEIARQMVKLGREIESVSSHLNSLYQRLEPVLGPGAPQPGNPNKDIQEAASTRIGIQLQEFRSALHAMKDVTLEMLARLEV